MHVQSALNSFVSTIGKRRRDSIKSHGTSPRARASREAYTESFNSSHSTELLKHTSHSPPEPKVSICSFIRDTLATGLSKVRMVRKRQQSRAKIEPVSADAGKHRLANFPNVFTRRPETNFQTSHNEKSNEQYHSQSTNPRYSQNPPLLGAKDKSESSGATKLPSINWYARPPDINGTPAAIAELIVQPSTSPWGRITFATSVGPNGLKRDSWRDARSISHFLGEVHKEEKTTRTGPFWDRKYQNLHEAVTKVMERNELSGKGTPGGAWIGVREDTQRFSACPEGDLRIFPVESAVVTMFLSLRGEHPSIRQMLIGPDQGTPRSYKTPPTRLAMSTNSAIPAQSSRGATSSFVGVVLQNQPGLGFHISIGGPKWRDDVDLPVMEIGTEAFRTNSNSPGWQMWTDEHQKRLDNDALIAADEISRDLENSLGEHVAKHRKTWKQGQKDLLTGYCCKPHLRQLRSHLASRIAQYNGKLGMDHSIAHNRIGLKTYGHGGTYIRDTRPSRVASSTRNRPLASAYPCEYELMTGPDPYRCSLNSFLEDSWSEIPFAEEVQAGTLVLQINTSGDRIKSSRWVDKSRTLTASPEVTTQLALLLPFSRGYISILEEERFGGYGQSQSITDAVDRLRLKEVGNAGRLFRNLAVEIHDSQTRDS